MKFRRTKAVRNMQSVEQLRMELLSLFILAYSAFYHWAIAVLPTRKSHCPHEILCDFAFVWSVSDKSIMETPPEHVRSPCCNKLNSIQQRSAWNNGFISCEWLFVSILFLAAFFSSWAQIFAFNWSYFKHLWHWNLNHNIFSAVIADLNVTGGS